MNTIPRLFLDPSWATIRSMSGNELVELAMLAVLSVGLVAAVLWGVYVWFFRKRGDED